MVRVSMMTVLKKLKTILRYDKFIRILYIRPNYFNLTFQGNSAKRIKLDEEVIIKMETNESSPKETEVETQQVENTTEVKVPVVEEKPIEAKPAAPVAASVTTPTRGRGGAKGRGGRGGGGMARRGARR